MAEQFNVTQQEVAYAPKQATDFVREFDRHIAERDAMNKPYEASLRARTRQGVEDANRQAQEMEQLAKLSNSLMNKLTKIQERANEEQYAQGLADALMEPVDLEGQAELEAQENELVAGQSIATQTADKYLAEGGSEGNAREIRNTGGWYGYGRFVGQLQMLGDNYGAALEDAKSTFAINIDGREVTYDKIQTKDEYNTWTRAFNAQYLKGVPRTNGDVVEKYVLREVRAQGASDRAQWTQKFNEDRKAEELEVRQSDLAQAINRGDVNIAQRAFATYPGSNRDIRLELESNLISLIDAGMISPHQALQFYQNQTIVKDGKVVPMAQAFKKQYAEFQDEVQKATTKEDNEYYAGQRSAAAELDRTLRSSDTRLTDLQIAEIMKNPKYANNTEAQNVLKAYMTSEELDDLGSRAYLDDLYRSGNLTREQLNQFPHSIQKEYENKVTETESINSDYDPSAAQRIVRGQVREALQSSIGETLSTDDATYQLLERNGKEIHQEAYAEARRRGFSHQQAMEYAQQELEAEAKEYVELKDESDLARRLELPDIAVSSTKITNSRKFIEKNGVNKAVIPNSDVEYAAAKEYLRTGKGSMPGFFTALAANQPFTAEQLVLKQAQLRGDSEFLEKAKSSPITKERQALPPDVQRLLTVAPNPMTFAQGAVRTLQQGGDVQFFLDSVAAYESTSMGGYDAYNLGGSQGGHKAHGSGNSAKDGRFGKPISQLTIGEIKRLHAAGQLHAAGRYQFVAGTFREVAPLTGLPDSTVFGPKVQDLFAITRLIQRASWGNLQTGLGKEWIGVQNMPEAEFNQVLGAARRIVESRK